MPNHNHDHHHTCCQVPSHVSDAGPGARVVAALKSGQLFAFWQSVNNHEDDDDEDGNDDDNEDDDDYDGNDDDNADDDGDDGNDDVIYSNKLIGPPVHSAQLTIFWFASKNRSSSMMIECGNQTPIEFDAIIFLFKSLT